MNNLKPNAERAKTAVILIWIVTAIDLIALTSDLFQYNLLQNAAHGVSITTEEATANDTRQQLIGLAYMVVYLVSAVTFIMWFRRACFNLQTKVSSLSFTEGWAAGAWFVPILSLYRPYQIMKELHFKTEELLSEKIPDYAVKTNYTTLGWWWAIWITSNLVGQFVFRYSQHANTVDELIIATGAGIISSLIGVPLAIITVKIIKEYSSIEPLLFEINEEGANTMHGKGFPGNGSGPENPH